MIKNIIIFILILLLAYAGYNGLLSWRYTTKETVKTEVIEKEIIIRDTVKIKEPVIITKEKLTPSKIPLYNPILKRQSKDSIEVILPIHVYKDEIKKDSSSFAYNIKVRGYLDSFKYDFRTHTQTVNTITTITNTKNRIIDLYTIAGFRNVPYVGVDFSLKRYKIGYRIDLAENPNHSLEFGYRFFDF